MALEGGATLSELFGALSDNLQFAINQIKEGENKRVFPPDFALDQFWNHIGSLVQAISQEATKLCLAFSKPPTPTAEDSQPLVERMEKLTLALVSAYYGFPPFHGTTLQKMLRKCVINIIQGTQNLIIAMKSANFQGSPEQLQSAGNVWECCDNFPSLPKDNKLAVFKVCKDTENLIKDAHEEIDNEHRQFLECNENELSDDDATFWTSEESKVVSAAMGLIKTSRALAKKVCSAVQQHGECLTEVNNNELDNIAEKVERLSPSVDDFTLTLYPPVNKENVLAQGEELAVFMTSVLHASRNSHITNEDDQSWVEFIEKAIVHNRTKLETT